MDIILTYKYKSAYLTYLHFEYFLQKKLITGYHIKSKINKFHNAMIKKMKKTNKQKKTYAFNVTSFYFDVTTLL